MKFRPRLFSCFLCFIILTSPVHATIKVGTEFFYPPFVISTSEGFDIGVMQTLCQRLKQDCEFIPMDFHEIFPALDSGKIDIAIGGISVSLKRLQKYIFSLPYLVSKGQFLILNTSNNIKSSADLNGTRVGVIKGEEDGSVTYQFLVDNYNGNFKIIEFDDMEDLISALSNGDIAAAFIHKSTAHYWVQNGGEQFQLLGNPMIVGQGIGIMALPTSSDLIQRINQELQGMEKDNSYVNLYKTYMDFEK